MYNGVINVYKEKGCTSHDVVNRLRRILGQKKIGHTGTLDPEADGVLPVCMGAGTKLCDMFTDRTKEYAVVMKLGIVTDTQDLTGQILKETPVHAGADEIRAAAFSFLGTYDQLPPMYSAVKLNGRKLYELARKGIEVERKPRPVTIRSITFGEISGDEAAMNVVCEKGTYIRTLCADIGEKLGCGGCVKSLRRTRVGDFTIDDALSMSRIEELHALGTLGEKIVPVDAMFPDAPKAHVNAEANYRLRNGNQFYPEELVFTGAASLPALLRLYDSDGNFCGLYRWDERRSFYHPEKMFLPM